MDSQIQKAIKESERSYNQEHALRHSMERQFIDDFKRAILTEGNYIPSRGIPSLGPEPVESQVMISASFGMDKIRPRPPQQNLVKMTRALLEEDESYTEDRRIRLVEEDDESASDGDYESLESPDSDNEAVDSSHEIPTYQTSGRSGAGHAERIKDILPLPRTREEEREQLARALRESSSRNPLSGASLRGSAAVHGHNSSTQPLPPPTDRHTSAGSDRYAEPLPPPRAPRSSVTAGRVARRERLEEPDMGPSESSRRIAGGDSGWRAR